MDRSGKVTGERPSALPGASSTRPRSALEMWSGVECTVNRVGDRYFDQTERSGHAARPADLDALAALGVPALRYPLLWERIEPDGPESARWEWADERMERLRSLGIRPIVGLVHHGSGPRHTELLDPAFPSKLAAFARRVAERYPWVESWTPVNEPLTTARFSALYGHWYPHRTDAWSFARAFVAQCEAVRQAMLAVREVVPDAQLVQTEDLGKTHSTPQMAYQARFENERRWATWDLLAGRLAPHDLMWRYLVDSGVSPHALHQFRDSAPVPMMLGVNHYVTSERFIDQRLERYPAALHGGNGRHRYVDVEAVRVRAGGVAGPAALLQEAWQRYGLPIAVTEAHLGCTREQQLRWLARVWEAAEGARRDGADVRAVTAWSAFGSFDWNSLLTADAGHYEPGLFDVRSTPPRPTALAAMVRDLATGAAEPHPTVAGTGWWEEDTRLLYLPADSPVGEGRAGCAGPRLAAPSSDGGRERRPVLITGATGTLGRAFARVCEERGLAYELLTRGRCDIADAASVEGALDGVRPWAVVNTAGYVRVDDAEADRDRCFRENADGARVLAEECARRGTALVTFSSDLVFDGEKNSAYVESDAVRPLGVYGESKAAAERAVREAHPRAMVVRTSAFFGPWDEHNFLAHALGALGRGERFGAASDAVVSPTYVPDLAHAALDLLVDGADGVWHLANPGATTWADFARRGAAAAGLDAGRVDGCPTASLGLRARRPGFSALTSERALLLPPLENAICRYVAARAPQHAEPRPSVQQLA
jgi:dTDP-4-dehydrorhamnose reductase